jgi:protein subunit release factor B
MINPALKNLDDELKKDDQELQKVTADEKAAVTKITTLSGDIKKEEEAIREEKAKIVELERDIRTKNDEVRKTTELDKKLVNEIRSKKQKRDADHLKLTSIARANADAIRKSEIENRNKTHVNPSVN